MPTRPPRPATAANDAYVRDYSRHLRAENRSPKTVTGYASDLLMFRRFTGDADLGEATRADVERFMADQVERLAANSAAIRYRTLRAFYNWMVEEGIRDASPVTGLSEPSTPRLPVPVLPDDYIAKLLASMSGKTFDDRRDTAVVRLFVDTPLRLSSLAGLLLTRPDGTTDVDLDLDVVRAVAKGDRHYAVPFGPTTGQALTRYLRERAKHRHHRLPQLWIGSRGAMTPSGIYQMVARRAAAAGLPHAHPHQFRHTFAHEWKKAGGSDEDLMRIGGWTSAEVLRRYGESAADDRAVAAHRRMRLGERL